MQTTLGKLITFHNNNQILIKNMSAILAAILDFSKILFCTKPQQILLKLVENMCLQRQIGIKLRTESKRRNRNKFCQKVTFFYFKL